MYEKTIWTLGDTITAEKLNKIEDALDQLLNGTASDHVESDPNVSDGSGNDSLWSGGK